MSSRCQHKSVGCNQVSSMFQHHPDQTSLRTISSPSWIRAHTLMFLQAALQKAACTATCFFLSSAETLYATVSSLFVGHTAAPVSCMGLHVPSVQATRAVLHECLMGICATLLFVLCLEQAEPTHTPQAVKLAYCTLPC